MGQRWLDGYSADVEIYLLLNGKRLEVAQIAGDTLILSEKSNIPPGSMVTLVIIVDGHEERDQIILQEGADSAKELVPFF